MAGRLAGNVAFISGVARGQGRSHAVRLAREGADIIGVDICGDVGETARFYPPATVADLAETVKLVEELGRRIVVNRADVRDADAVRTAMDEGVAQVGRLDIVVANAGIYQFGDQAHQISEQDWCDVLDVDLTGVWQSCKASIPHLIDSGRGGSIILIASATGIKGVPQLGHYVAAKHGVVGLMKTLALELARHQIRVNVVAPSICDTDMVQNERTYRLFLPDHEQPTRTDFAELCATLHPLSVPWVEPIDVSNAVLFLASDEARYITGVTLPVDAGKAVT